MMGFFTSLGIVVCGLAALGAVMSWITWFEGGSLRTRQLAVQILLAVLVAGGIGFEVWRYNQPVPESVDSATVVQVGTSFNPGYTTCYSCGNADVCR